MISIEDFRLARRVLSVAAYCREFSDPGAWDHFDETDKRALRILTYPGGYYIEDLENVREGDRYYLILERSEFMSDDVSELEAKLYEYAATEGLEDVKREDLPHVKAAKAAHAIANALLVLSECYDASPHVETVTCEAGDAGIIPRSIDEWAHDWFAMSTKLEGGKA